MHDIRRGSQISLILLCVAFIGQASMLRAEDSVVGFKDPPPRAIVETPYTDAAIDDLVATLDGLLEHEADSDQWGLDAGNHLWTFVERLQNGTLTAAQESRVEAHLDAIARQHPEGADVIAKYRYVVSSLTVGKVAPDIVGKDLDGKELRLGDYRGQIVVLAFSGDWCGACRVEYPYQKLLIDLYKDRPLTILSVNSDADPQIAKKAKTDRGLTYRSWWDGYAEKSTHGPIASAWAITGWPTTYLIDEDGVIRFVNLRQEDMLKGVKQLIGELARKSTHQF
jgi:peroxiredoxin